LVNKLILFYSIPTQKGWENENRYSYLEGVGNENRHSYQEGVGK
jgi:hypothetical protein